MRRLVLSVSVVLTLVAALAPGASAAAAVATEGVGEAITPVANLEYADRFGTGKNQGTDLEFATLTVPGSESPEPSGPGKSEGKGRGKGRPTTGDAQPTGTDVDPDAAGVQRRYAVAGSYDNGMHIIDITDPTSPVLAGRYDCGISQGDVQIFERDGRTYATYTMDAAYTLHEESQCVEETKALGLYEGTGPGSPLAVDAIGAIDPEGAFGRPGIGTYIADITDPANPKTVSYVASLKGAHNMTVHPSGLYLYESNSQLYTTAADAGIEVFDISDFSAPTRVAKLALPPTPGLGAESHDLTFNTEGTRAYAAALSQTVSINTEDPANPSIVSVIVDPTINVHHQADPATLTDKTTGQTRDFLIIEDEFVGALGTGQCPNGGVHVYDITGPLENAPVKVGYWNIDEVRETDSGISNTGISDPPFGAISMQSCTAHVFDINEEEALMTIAFYNGGVRVVDLSNLVGVSLGKAGVGMKQVGYYRFPDSNTWAVKAPEASRDGFYLFGNDIQRGFDVYRYEPAAAPASQVDASAQWLTAAEVAARSAAAPKPTALTKDNAPFCLLRKV